MEAVNQARRKTIFDNSLSRTVKKIDSSTLGAKSMLPNKLGSENLTPTLITRIQQTMEQRISSLMSRADPRYQDKTTNGSTPLLADKKRSSFMNNMQSGRKKLNSKGFGSIMGNRQMLGSPGIRGTYQSNFKAKNTTSLTETKANDNNNSLPMSPNSGSVTKHKRFVS